MNPNEIIEELYIGNVVRTICNNISHGRESQLNLKDLELDIYEHLLNMDLKKLVKLYNDNELNFYLASVIYTLLRSATSYYYRDYKKFDKKTVNNYGNEFL